MGQDIPLDLAVPDELLRTAMARSKASGDEASVKAALALPGVGGAALPSLRSILTGSGMRGITLTLTAAFLVHTLESGIGILGPDIQDTFGLSDAGLGVLAFLMGASYFGLGVPVALGADRGSRTRVSGLALLSWALVVPLLAFAPNPWVFALLLIAAGVGRAAPNSAHLSYLADAYPLEGRARVFALHQAARPLASTLGAAVLGGGAALAGGTEGWRWVMVFGLLGIPAGLALLRLPDPTKGTNERRHVLGEETSVDEVPPRLLFGSAVQRLLRIRSLYFMFVAIAVLGFAAVGIPLIGNLYLEERWDLGAGGRATVAFITGGAAFLGIPVAGFVGDRLFQRKPGLPLLVGGASLAAFGIVYSLALHMPRLGLVVAGFFLAEACLAPLATAMTQTVAATAPPALRSLTFALFGIYSLVFGGFAGGVVLGAVSDAKGPTFALTLMGPITLVGGALLAYGSRHVSDDIVASVADVLEEHEERTRVRKGGAVKALQVHNLDFAYGANQVLFDVDLEVDDGEICALLGTNGAGKSTLLRVVAGLEHPHAGTVRLFGTNTTWLEAEQVLGLGVSLLSGGKMTFPSLTVEENLRAGSYGFRRDRAIGERIERVYAAFPQLAQRRAQRAGTLSGGEQQMLALGRALLARPRLLLIDELTLGLAPMIVEELLGFVREINAEGTTVVLVEQSVNLALTLADRSVFLERGAVRFDGSTTELLTRSDLLRPVFLNQEATS